MKILFRFKTKNKKQKWLNNDLKVKFSASFHVVISRIPETRDPVTWSFFFFLVQHSWSSISLYFWDFGPIRGILEFHGKKKGQLLSNGSRSGFLLS